jgi:hypothetical protein
MPEGVLPAPLPDLRPAAAQEDLVCHLIAISMDKAGWPIGLFTTNRWVTAETWYAAHDVAALLGNFDLRLNKPCWPVNRFLSAMLVLFRPQIEELLQQRDARLRAWQRQHPGVNAYEDRRLEVASQLPVSVEAQVLLLEQRLGA